MRILLLTLTLANAGSSVEKDTFSIADAAGDLLERLRCHLVDCGGCKLKDTGEVCRKAANAVVQARATLREQEGRRDKACGSQTGTSPEYIGDDTSRGGGTSVDPTGFGTAPWDRLWGDAGPLSDCERANELVTDAQDLLAQRIEAFEELDCPDLGGLADPYKGM
jgi:hypothetical protein